MHEVQTGQQGPAHETAAQHLAADQVDVEGGALDEDLQQIRLGPPDVLDRLVESQPLQDQAPNLLGRAVADGFDAEGLDTLAVVRIPVVGVIHGHAADRVDQSQAGGQITDLAMDPATSFTETVHRLLRGGRGGDGAGAGDLIERHALGHRLGVEVLALLLRLV